VTSASTSGAAPSAFQKLAAVPGRWLFRWRNLVFPVVFLGLLFVGRPRLPFGSASADVAMDAFGILLACLGQLVRAGVVGLAYVVRGGPEGEVHADRLVTHGLFAHCRNPLYVGNLLVFFGLFVTMNSWPGWLVGVPAAIFTYVAIVSAEEIYLSNKFGVAYDEYRRRVPRFGVRWKGLAATLRGTPFDGRRVIRKEYGQAFAWMLGIFAVLLRERFANGRGAEVLEHRVAWMIAFGVLLGAYSVTRFLKKTGRLNAS
jgi:protein-S-isoprenylcysteine O-methyltransferase Ste14